MGIEVAKNNLLTIVAQIVHVECYVGNSQTGEGCSVDDASVKGILRPPGSTGSGIMVMIASR